MATQPRHGCFFHGFQTDRDLDRLEEVSDPNVDHMCVQESNVCKYGRRIRVSIVDESKRQTNLNKFKGLEYL